MHKILHKRHIRHIKNEMRLRKFILIAILLTGLVFILLQFESFLSPSTFMNDTKVKKVSINEDDPLKTDPQKLRALRDDIKKYEIGEVTEKSLSMRGTKTITQKFTARHGMIKQVRLYFHNPDNYTAKGKVYVAIKNSHGKKIASASLSSSMIANDAVTVFDFVENSSALNADKIVNKKIATYKRNGIPLVKGHTYTLQVRSDGVSADSRFALCLCEQHYDKAGSCVYDGSTQEGTRIFGAIRYLSINGKILFLFILAIAMAILFILLPRDKIGQWLQRKYNWRMDFNQLITRIMFFDTPFVCYIIVDKFHGPTMGTIFKGLFSLDGLLNMLIIGMICWTIFTIWNRCKYTIITTTGIFFGFGVANYVLLVFRDSPLAWTDFASIGTAMDVAGNYSLYFNQAFLWSFVITLIHVTIALSLRPYKSFAKKQRITALLGLALWVGGVYYMIFASSLLQKADIYVSGFRPKWSYNSHGYTLAFVITIKTSRISKPEVYSPEKAEKIAAAYISDKGSAAAAVSEKTPNIIVIMNEAYSDLRSIHDFKTNKDYAPYFDSLRKNTVKGTLHTSIFGGSTANTEYEFLTGNSMSALPFHTVAYNNNVKVQSPSLATTLAAQGYKGLVALHPGMYNSYNRNVVYPNLGFKKYISLEDMKNPEKLRAYVSDKADYEELMHNYESFRKKDPTSPFFMFNVTIQNHSDFKLTSGVVENQIHIEDSALNLEQASQYLNLVKKSDSALRELVEYYKKQNDPTIIVLFGDHQPRVEDAFYEELLRRRGSGLSDLQKSELQYQVPFMIWANYDIKEKENVQISANYLSSYLLSMLGGKQTGYNKFLLDLRSKVPFITSIAYETKDGTLHAPGDASQVSKALQQYAILEYNYIVDTKNRVKGFFELQK